MEFPGVDQTILTVARACRSELRACVQLPNLLRSQWAHDRVSDFELWDNGVGASAREQDSLDLRLEEDETSKKVVLTSLNTLLAWIKLCQRLAEDKILYKAEKKKESDALEEDAEFTLDEAMRGVEEIQALLVKLGVAIRQAGTASRLRNADRVFESKRGEYQDILDLEKSLEFLLRLPKRDLQLSGSEQENLSQKSLGLEQRILIEANALRRFRFHFARSRSANLRSQPGPSYDLQEATDPNSLVEMQQDMAHKVSNSTPRSNQSPSQLKQAYRAKKTDAAIRSQVDSSPLSEHQNNVSITNVEIEITAPPTARAIASDYPKAPQTTTDYFSCPYCYFPKSSEVAQKDSMWRKHVSVDLQPYTCYLPSCQHKFQFFDTFRDWSLHVSSDEHRSYTWICCYCDDIVSFATETSFLEHLTQQHANNTSETTLDNLVLSCQSQDVPTMDTCPVCLLDESTWKDRKTSNDTRESKNRMFIEHIGDCLHSFALRALPVPDEQGTEATSVGEPGFRPSQQSILDMSTSAFSEPDGQYPGPTLADVAKIGEDTDPKAASARILAWRETVIEANIGSEFALHDDDDSSPQNWDLQQKILSAYYRTLSDQMFLPQNDLFQLITKESVYGELERVLGDTHPPVQIEAWAAQVCSEIEINVDGKSKIQSFRKIFALLVIAETSATIPRFLGENVSDLDLPLVPTKGNGISGFSRKDSATPLRCFQRWSPMRLEKFNDHQWRMLAAYFSTRDGKAKHYRLQDQHILPFVASGNRSRKIEEIQGVYSRILMVDLHPDHYYFPHVPTQANNGKFAVKQQIYESDRQSFEKESDILRMFSGDQSHPHIVSLLATYEHLGKYHLLFHRAEGSLHELWKDLELEPAFKYENITWMAEQCSGIAEGLRRLHQHLEFTAKQHPDAKLQSLIEDVADPGRDGVDSGHDSDGCDVPAENASILDPPLRTAESSQSVLEAPIESQEYQVCDIEGHNSLPKVYGIHGDIHPGNMLWFVSDRNDEHLLSGTIQIADFGQAELNCRICRRKPRDVVNTVTYRAPESDIPDCLIDPSLDIWGLGCVYLEFVTWMLGGAKLQKRFSKARLAPDPTENRYQTDKFFDSIVDPISFKQESKVKSAVIQCIQELHRHPNCTEFFHDLLNTIQLDMLVINALERSSCTGIAERLRKMLTRCHSDITYAAAATPWIPRRGQMESSS